MLTEIHPLYALTHTLKYIYIYIHTHTHTYSHIHTHTHTFIHVFLNKGIMTSYIWNHRFIV